MADYDPTPNTPQTTADKALAAFFVALAALVVQFVVTNFGIQLDEEGITAIFGAAATLAVYRVRNYIK